MKEHREFVLHEQGQAPVSISYHFSYNHPSVEESMMQQLIWLFACGAQHPDVVVLNMVVLLYPPSGFNAKWMHNIHTCNL